MRNAEAVHMIRGLRRDIRKNVTTFNATGEKTGWMTKPDGYELGDIQLFVDLDKLARIMGSKAMKNSSGRSTIAWGCCKVKVIRRERVQP